MKKTKIIITLVLLLLIILVSALPTLYLPYYLKTSSEENIIQLYGDYDFVYIEKFQETLEGETLNFTRTKYVYKSNFIFENLYLIINYHTGDERHSVDIRWGEEWMEGGEIVEYTGN